MSDRIKGLTVTFSEDIRDDDAQCVIDAIKMIKGVMDVHPSVRTPDDHMNRMRIRRELEEKLWNALKSD